MGHTCTICVNCSSHLIDHTPIPAAAGPRGPAGWYMRRVCPDGASFFDRPLYCTRCANLNYR